MQLSKEIKRVEILLAIVSILTFAANVYNLKFSGEAFIMLILSVATFYMFSGFILFSNNNNDDDAHSKVENESKTGSILAIATGLMTAILIVGILFKSQQWPSFEKIILFSLVGLGLLSILGCFVYRNQKSFLFGSFLKRTGILIGFGLFFSWLPNDAILDYKYRNYPAYLNALKLQKADPDDEEKTNNLFIEIRKMRQDLEK